MFLLHFRTIILCTYIFFVGSVEAQSRHKQKYIGHATVSQRQSRNPNEPNYIFILPENQTLVLRKSDFDHVIYPNVTNMNKFSKGKKQSIIKNRDLQNAGSVNKVNFYDRDEQDLENIVKENIQTERNFVNFIEEMNHDLNSEDIKVRTRDKGSTKKGFKAKIETNKQNEWEDLGLDGWEGAITERQKNKTKKG